MVAIGPTLRSARESRGLSIELVAQETRISPRFLEALEDERFEALPAPVYVRGFLRSYANYLHVDATPLMNELNARQGSPVIGPDGFVTGPTPRPTTRDPWRQRPQAATRTRTMPVPHEPPPTVAAPPVNDAWAPEEPDESWAPEPSDYVQSLSTPVQEYDYVPGVDYPPEALSEAAEATYRPRRVAGVLIEREAEYNNAGGPMRTIALAGGALVALAFFAIVGLLILNGGSNDRGETSPAAGGAETPASRAGTQVSVGTATFLASPSPTPSVTVTGTPGTETPSPTVGTPTPPPTPQPTATLRPGEPTPTATALPPTPTVVPPTATPPPPTQRPPTQIPTAVISHPSGTSECSGGVCGRPGPNNSVIYLVVCAPDGWFIDAPANGDFTADGGVWPRRTSSSVSGAASVCG